MSAAAVPWLCTVGPVIDIPGRWVCVPDGAEELTGTGADEDEALESMAEHYETQVLH